MCWIGLLLLLWFSLVAFTYMVFYYESANGPHLEVLRSHGSVPLLLLRGFFHSLSSHVLVVFLTLTTLYRKFWLLPAGPATRTPVIFVHGLYHNRTAWYFYLRWFRQWGWQQIKAINLGGVFRSIKDYEQVLATEIEEILAATGSEQVDLVGHSMGGLVIRSYLAGGGGRNKVRRVVTLGSPHSGSKLSVFGPGSAAKEMRPDSPFLAWLNGIEPEISEGGHFYTIYTVMDNMVLPNESAILSGPGMNPLETRVVDHLGLLYSKYTANMVRQCLEGS
jgi:pimeloyl-ACP methyl ester carboxylesterase